MSAPAGAVGARWDDGLTRVLVVGVPRSGTSWAGRVLGSTPGATYLGEPDNHEHVPFALRAKLGLPGYLYPLPATSAPAYERLWRSAFAPSSSTGLLARARRKASVSLLRRSRDSALLDALRGPARPPLRLRASAALAVPAAPDRPAHAIVVKSVHAQLALPWIVDRFPAGVVVVLRHPLNVLSSWLQLGWLDGVLDPLDELEPAVRDAVAERLGLAAPPVGGSRIAQATWLIGLLTCALRDAADAHPTWTVVSHEELCVSAHGTFAAVASAVGLLWSPEVDGLLDDLNRPGTGYETSREAAGLADVWRSRLAPEVAHEALGVLDAFPGGDWTPPLRIGRGGT